VRTFPLSLLPALVALWTGTAPAHGSTLVLSPVGRVGTTVSDDGERYIASATGEGPADVFDVATGRHTSVVPPAGCAFQAVGADSLLFQCGNFGPARTFELGTGATGELPALRGLPASADSVMYTAIGRRWAQGFVGGYHYSYPVFVDRRTGRQVKPDFKDRTRLPDLSSPHLMTRLCRPIRTPLTPFDPYVGEIGPGPITVHGRSAVSIRSPRRGLSAQHVVLSHCGRRSRVLRSCGNRRYGSCAQPLLDDRIVAWIHTYDPPGRSVWTLNVLSRRTNRVRVARVPLRASLALIRRRLYVVADGQLLHADL
jgi:hypothetical protein